MQWRKIRKGEVRNSKWEAGIIILNTVIRESLTKNTFEQTYKGDVDEPHRCLRHTLQAERTASAKAQHICEVATGL